ncbi:unnamed protein product [Miscanthus lutarioriparius]|uniref:Uncharacterized protein n=1 Tax=Miscanthus lutarioriparius TaxID=422564 RepID=A0A811MGG8_9POAL|nr:unnamed protein product [Miscanthus lutarioriparius]
MVSDLDLVGFFYYPSLVSVGAGIGDVGFSGGKLGRYVYQLEKSGWSLSPSFSGGLHPPLGDSLSGKPELLVDAPDPLLSGDVMATGHLDRLVPTNLSLQKMGIEKKYLQSSNEVFRKIFTLMQKWRLFLKPGNAKYMDAKVQIMKECLETFGKLTKRHGS